MTKYIYAYNQASASSRDLARAMGVNRIRHEGSTFRGGPNKTVINWGANTIPNAILANGTTIINSPNRVADATNKLNFFRTQTNAGAVTVPPWTDSRNAALAWLQDGKTVMARTMLRASSARGLVVVEPDEELPDAPLYTMYVKKQEEYRVHVLHGEVIDIQRKGLRQEFVNDDDVNWKVRNIANGFVFVRNDGHVPPPIIQRQAIAAVQVMRLDFGAVDIIYNTHRATSYVLEVNTAPGLMGTTLDNYVRAFNNL